MIGAPMPSIVAMANNTLTMVGSMFRYSAMPPHTPVKGLLVWERVSLFVMVHSFGFDGYFQNEIAFIYILLYQKILQL